ncbi:DeoR/GlpR family DNA-binding transcription regulator [Bowmanella sp. Y26]|uniref:DeoR/GlpR family DNA-binding transcription regulator n=1 Tax=Bowmanella yangjiangensis TaxID=2811230 RepID=UPI001BDCE8CD|nr:DeoR/GlpR family DNA-binding transcription regulator [Bowmanella yangjiangensis]MBT1062200.1 DeoR/GlpR family DNA-binding transcription regulator [Bowmanella yangjiangensis]
MSIHLDLNNPDTRQALLTEKLQQGQLVAKALAEELGVSLDTIRRDLMALESAGLLRRVKGGALPVNLPVMPLRRRINQPESWLQRLPAVMKRIVHKTDTLFLDGGVSVLHFAKALPAGFSGLAITPSPYVAIELQSKNIDTLLIGGKLQGQGGIACGADTVAQLQACAADLCILGTCGLDTTFGLSADDSAEASVKRQMAINANKVIALAGAEKLHRRARHKVLSCEELDLLLTDADQQHSMAFYAKGVEIVHV